MNLNDIKDIPIGGKYCEKCGTWIPLAKMGKCEMCENLTPKLSPLEQAQAQAREKLETLTKGGMGVYPALDQITKDTWEAAQKEVIKNTLGKLYESTKDMVGTDNEFTNGLCCGLTICIGILNEK